MSEEALQISVNRREVKGKGEKERYIHLNAEFQRIAKRDKKVFLSDHCKKKKNNIKKRWQEYTEELYKKDLHNPDGVITHLELDTLECKVTWALGSSKRLPNPLQTKLVEVTEFQLSYFKS